jgi:hypothetical protein
LLVSAFSDADRACCIDDRISTGGYVMFLGTNLECTQATNGIKIKYRSRI